MSDESLSQSLITIKTDESGLTYAEFDGHIVRVGIDAQGELYFVASDLVKGLGIKDASRAVERLDDDEKGTISIRTLRGDQDVLVVSEPGLYNLVLSARNTKPQVKAFKRRITHDVLPAIRKHGGYISPTATPEQIAGLESQIATLKGKLADSYQVNRWLGGTRRAGQFIESTLPTRDRD